MQARTLISAAFVFGSFAAVATAVTGAFASAGGRDAGVTLALQPFTSRDCPAPKVVVGTACVDRSGMILSAAWTTVADGNAVWAPANWRNTYSWTVPKTIAPAGTAMTMKLQATELTKIPNARICPGIDARGGVDFRTGKTSLGQPVELNFCAESGRTETGSKTVTVVPPTSAPAPVYIEVRLGDGPHYVYKYKPVAEKRCRKPAGARRHALDHAGRGCEYIVTYSFDLRGSGATGQGHGKVRGEDLKRRLEPVSDTKDDDENFIRVEVGNARLLLDVDSARYFTQKAKDPRVSELQHLRLETKVLKSNSRDCPRGTTVTVDVEQRDNNLHSLSIDGDGACKLRTSTSAGALHHELKISVTP